jgi:hypothetical protein
VRTVDGAGRVLGLFVFVVGVLLLIAVFYLAYRELLPAGSLAATASAQNALLVVVAKGVFLFITGFIASAIANKGISLYQAAVHAQE